MTISITDKQLESLVERAYLNGVSAVGVARSQGKAMCDVDDYKKTTAYHEMQQIIQQQS